MKYEQPKHHRKDRLIGFVRGKVQIRVGNNDYVADVILADDKKIGLIFYDIINLNKTTIKAAGNSPVLKSKNAKTATASKQTVPQSSQNGNSHSLEISYALDSGIDLFTDIVLGGDYVDRERFERNISILEEGAKALKDKEVNRAAVRKIANQIKQEYSSTYMF